MKSAMSKSRPMNLVLHNQLSARKNPVNLVTVDEERGGHSGSGKQWRTDQSQDPIEYSQVRRQENTQHADSWRQGHRDESSSSTGAGGEHEDRVSKHEDHKPSRHNEGFPIFAKEIGNHSGLLNICNGSNEDHCIDMEIVHIFVTESSHSSWTKLHRKFGCIHEHEHRGNSEFISTSHRNWYWNIQKRFLM